MKKRLLPWNTIWKQVFDKFGDERISHNQILDPIRNEMLKIHKANYGQDEEGCPLAEGKRRSFNTCLGSPDLELTQRRVDGLRSKPNGLKCVT